MRTSETEAQPPPPPPMPVMSLSTPATPVPFKRSQSIRSTATNGDRMQDELNTVLTLFREKRRDIDIRPTPEVFINQKSNPDEVQSWLKAKEFSENVCQKFKGFSGHQLLGLSRTHAEIVGGQIEGKRLYSQINIQKSVCGFQTARSSELRAILARAREKIEPV